LRTCSLFGRVDLHLPGYFAFDPVRDLRQRLRSRFARVTAFLICGDIGHPAAEKKYRNGGREDEGREKPEAFGRPF
jgi:hypothetical protein